MHCTEMQSFRMSEIQELGSKEILTDGLQQTQIRPSTLYNDALENITIFWKIQPPSSSSFGMRAIFDTWTFMTDRLTDSQTNLQAL